MHPEAQLPIHIDSTMIACFRSCPRKFYNEFVLGRRPPGLSIDLHAGACFATALETVYRETWLHNRPLSEALLRSQAAFWIAWADFEIPEWKRTTKTPDRVWAAVEAYFARWSPLTDPIRPYFAADGKPTFEYTFAVPLEGSTEHSFPLHPSGSPFLYSGRYDMLGEYEGRPVIRDEKTTKNTMGADWSRQWQFRNQFIGYTWASRQCGIPVEGVIVRGIQILKGDINLVDSGLLQYSDHTITLFYEQLQRDIWRLRRTWDEDYWDYNMADTCTSYGLCPYLDSCTSNRPEAWLDTFEVRRWNPLHKNPARVDNPELARAS